MTRDEFVEDVQHFGHLESNQQATAVTEAVLETLGECLYRTACDGLGAQLPKGIKELLYKGHPPEQSREQVDQISLEEFYNRVHARCNLGFKGSVNATMGVATVLRKAVSRGEREVALAHLPHDLKQLFL